jgi:hypothetical protein
MELSMVDMKTPVATIQNIVHLWFFKPKAYPVAGKKVSEKVVNLNGIVMFLTESVITIILVP